MSFWAGSFPVSALANNNLPTWAHAVAAALKWSSHRLHVQPVAGGDTCKSFLLFSSSQRAFVKSAATGQVDLFHAEADGLEALATIGSIRVPQVLAVGQSEEPKLAWLALEALDLQTRNERVDRALGQQIADLHGQGHERFGWRRDNFLGKTPQSNQPQEDWVTFFSAQRLRPQLNPILASIKDRQLESLLAQLIPLWKKLASGYKPARSLLHGDLWSGNAAALADGSPVIFDPAVHVGDRECDLAMADLFGGYHSAFFKAYEAKWPLPEGWQERREFYQLYHLLNHANLFGGSYLATVKRRIQRLQACC
jgi:fructosamine-3-kinase